jgi:NAD(P)H-nitrite reductase large subunit
MPEDHNGAILQRDKETFAIVPRTPAGLLTPDLLETLAAVTREFDIPIVKITSGQRIALVGIKKDDIPAIWERLGTGVGRAVELCVHYVQACPGTSVCRYGVQNSLELGLQLEDLFQGVDMPAKLKFGVSGCPFCCGESYVRDVGLIGTKKGWTVTFGGNAGKRVRTGDTVAEELSRTQAVQLVQRLVDFYRENGRKRERTSRFAKRLGIEAIRNAVLPLE